MEPPRDGIATYFITFLYILYILFEVIGLFASLLQSSCVFVKRDWECLTEIVTTAMFKVRVCLRRGRPRQS